MANIHEQFPDLAEDIKFPDFYPKERFFSSVLKIIFLSSHPKHMLWVLKRTVSLRWFF